MQNKEGGMKIFWEDGLKMYKTFTSHLGKCRHVPRSMGRLNAAIDHGVDASQLTEKHGSEARDRNKALVGPISNIRRDIISIDTKWALEVAFDRDIHLIEIRDSISVFHEPSRRDFRSI